MTLLQQSADVSDAYDRVPVEDPWILAVIRI